jgi:hypothetical protein
MPSGTQLLTSNWQKRFDPETSADIRTEPGMRQQAHDTRPRTAAVADEHRDPDTGQYTPRFTDEQLVQFVEANEPIGTSAVADEFECSQPAAYKRLSKLEETGEIKTDLIGGNRIWMRG